MREISQLLDRNLHKETQAKATASELSVFARIARPDTYLTSGKYLERTLISDASGAETVTDIGIAVAHPRAGGVNGDIWAVMADGGTLRVFRSGRTNLNGETTFTELDSAENAVSCAVAFDGVTVRRSDETEEFVTDPVPFLFWADEDGALHARKWGANEDTILASSDVVKVSAVRASYSGIDRFDFGLIVFFLTTSGTLFYRQRIKGVWYDAETVSFGPDVVYTDIAAFRTWDYRVGVQAITADGTVYNLFTQYEGIGTRNQEHVEITEITAEGTLTAVVYHDGYETEHVEITTISAAGGLWDARDIEIVDAYNAVHAEAIEGCELIYTGDDIYPGEDWI